MTRILVKRLTLITIILIPIIFYIMKDLNIVSLKDQIILAITQYGSKILLAIVVFIIGRFIIGKITKNLSSRMNKSSVDKDVQPFLSSLISVGLNVMLLLSSAGILGIQTTVICCYFRSGRFSSWISFARKFGKFCRWCFNLDF